MKSLTSFIVLSAVAVSCYALPQSPKRSTSSDINDGVILNNALTLEHLEDTFYREGLQSKQDFKDAGFGETFYNNLMKVVYDERTHVSFLTAALEAAGVTPVAECTYAFGVTSPQAFVATASILEGVGVTAYLGTAASIANKAYLTAPGSILTVESRHSSYIRASLKESPFPQPFDTPLDFNEVYTLAAPFIVSCPSGNPSLPFKSFPPLMLDSRNPAPVMNGSTVTLDTTESLLTQYSNKALYCAWINVTGPTFASAHISSSSESITCNVPDGFHGQSYVLLTGSMDMVTDDTVIAGPAIVEISGTSGGHWAMSVCVMP